MKQAEWYRQLGQALAHRRQQLGLTQTEAARELNIPYQLLQKYEKGLTRPPLHIVVRLAHLYRFSLSSLLPYLSPTPPNGTHNP